jgi:hypothetical protein
MGRCSGRCFRRISVVTHDRLIELQMVADVDTALPNYSFKRASFPRLHEGFR